MGEAIRWLKENQGRILAENKRGGRGSRAVRVIGIKIGDLAGELRRHPTLDDLRAIPRDAWLREGNFGPTAYAVVVMELWGHDPDDPQAIMWATQAA